jgi:CheY-like chemotaxis protein
MRPRLIFVDDEVEVLDALRNLLRRQRHDWELAFASGAEQALELLQAEPVFGVVTDLRMPGMDGAALLEQVRLAQPGTVRIVLSGHAEEDLLLRALPSAHQLLGKPCDPQSLQPLLQQLLALWRQGGWQELAALTCLPSAPALYARWREAAERLHLPSLVEVAQQDAALTAKLLQLANSLSFGQGPVRAVRLAIERLGPELLCRLARDPLLFRAGELPAPIDLRYLHALWGLPPSPGET